MGEEVDEAMIENCRYGQEILIDCHVNEIGRAQLVEN